MIYFDTHTHQAITDPDIRCIVNLSDDFDREWTGHYVSMGLHPWYLRDDTWSANLSFLSENVRRTGVLAIGECGLDRRTETPWALQLKVFEAQIALAQELNLPLIIHCVKAFEDITAVLRGVPVPVVIHGVNNKLSTLNTFLNAGYNLSFGRALTGNNRSSQEAFRVIPDDRILLETDDDAGGIREVYKMAAILKGADEKEIALRIETNFKRIFAK